MVVSNYSSRVICCIAALLPWPFRLQPVNFIFNALFLVMVQINLFEHGRKINELTFNTELLCNVLASSSRWCRGNPVGRDWPAVIDRNKYYLRRQHGAKFQPRELSDKLHDVKRTFSLYKTTFSLSFIPCFEKQSRHKEMETVTSSELFHTLRFPTAGQ